MKTNIIAILITTVIISACGGGGPVGEVLDTPTSGTIHITIDETLQPFMESEVFTFNSLYTRATVNASYSPESQCFADLLNDSSRLVVVTRTLTPDELATFEQLKIKPRINKIAYEAVAVTINNENPDSNLRYQQVLDLLSGKITKWKDINPKSPIKDKDIKLILDNNYSSIIRYLKDTINGGKPLPPNAFAVKSGEEVIKYIEKDPTSIGFISVSLVSDRDDPKMLAFRKQVRVAGISKAETPDEYVQPFQAYVNDRSYPFIRTVYIVSREARAGLGTGFAAFVAGDKGQRIILKSGLVPAAAPIRVVKME